MALVRLARTVQLGAAVALSRKVRYTPVIREQTDWLCLAVDAFQRVLLCASRPSIDVQKLERELLRIPAPGTPFERLASRYLMFDCFSAIVSSETGSRLQRQREFAAFLGALRSDSDLRARFSKLVMELCRPPEAVNASLADDIERRIERDYAARMTASRIAEEYNVTRVQLDRSFVRRFGLRFHAYLTSIRVRRGVDLVVGGMKIEAAARDVGYRSKKDFYHAVKLHTGSTPGQLRRRLGLAVALPPKGVEA